MLNPNVKERGKTLEMLVSGNTDLTHFSSLSSSLLFLPNSSCTEKGLLKLKLLTVYV